MISRLGPEAPRESGNPKTTEARGSKIGQQDREINQGHPWQHLSCDCSISNLLPRGSCDSAVAR
jgi:hypothetical protein